MGPIIVGIETLLVLEVNVADAAEVAGRQFKVQLTMREKREIQK